MKVRTNWVPNSTAHYDTAGHALDLLSRYRHIVRELTDPTAVSDAPMLPGLLTRAEGDRLLQNTPNL
jgi:hypothetical protein